MSTFQGTVTHEICALTNNATKCLASLGRANVFISVLGSHGTPQQVATLQLNFPAKDANQPWKAESKKMKEERDGEAEAAHTSNRAAMSWPSLVGKPRDPADEDMPILASKQTYAKAPKAGG
ncbi:hypothetical protein MKZ38_004565 [Zalerion maritima]|uniref:Uncharacterized protein n=1 Tax=Zalerion maritima TaxID=339359 RepID=A0AAD5WUZ7_9PEZI|nr:hypothetical protein MKZ38_004565 [Zalerion maritima]